MDFDRFSTFLKDFRHIGRKFQDLKMNFQRIFRTFLLEIWQLCGCCCENLLLRKFQDFNMNFYKDFRDILRMFGNSKRISEGFSGF